METIVVLMDHQVLRRGTDHGAQLDYGRLLEYLAAGRRIKEAYGFAAIDPRSGSAGDRDSEALRMHGYLVSSRAASGNAGTCDFGVELAVELVRIVHEIGPDVVVLVSDDARLAPAIEYARRKGVKIEAASFRRDASRDFLRLCSGFIELDGWLVQPGGGEP